MMDEQQMRRSEAARLLGQGPRTPRQVLRVTCSECGTEFTAHRVSRRYCSQRCNQRAYHERHRQRVSHAS